MASTKEENIMPGNVPMPILYSKRTGKQMQRNSEACQDFEISTMSVNCPYPIGLEPSAPDVRDEYDPYREREVSRQYSNVGAFFHLLKGGLGTGIMAMPSAFRHSGLAIGVLATLVTGFVCTHCMIILVSSAQKLYVRMRVPALGMGETFEAAVESGPKRLRPYAPYARHFVKISLFLCYALAMSAYTILIAESFKQVIEQNVGYVLAEDNVYIAVLAVVLVPFCQVRQLKHLVPFSFLSNLCIVVAFGITAYYLFADIPDPRSRRFYPEDVLGMPLFFATALFAMEGIGTIMPIENTMRDPTKMAPVMSGAMAVIVLLFASLGFLGYLRFGEDTLANIGLNLPVQEIPAQVVKGLLGVAIAVTVPVQFYVCAEILLDYASSWVAVQPSRRFLFDSAVRAALILACIVLAAAVPNLDLIIALVGAIFFSALGIFTPAVVETVVDWESSSARGGAARAWLVARNGTLVAISVFTAVSGVYAALYNAI